LFFMVVFLLAFSKCFADVVKHYQKILQHRKQKILVARTL